MKRRFFLAQLVCTIFVLCTFAAFSGTAFGQTKPKEFASRDATIDGATIHYTTGGSGPTVILLHGFAETSRMWNPILPILGAKFTVIAPDLLGIGDSSIPRGEMDMKTAAIQIHDLARSLGVTKARVVGHDIGLMVAYAYAAQFPSEVEKLVVMDAFLPGVAGWEPIYNDPNYWHFRFNGPTPEALVRGREYLLRVFLERPRRREEPFNPGSGSQSLYRRVFAPRTNGRIVEILRFLAPRLQGVRPNGANEINDARVVYRR